MNNRRNGGGVKCSRFSLDRDDFTIVIAGNVDNEILINWIREQIRGHENLFVADLGSICRDGKILCAIINHYRPDLLDYNAIENKEAAANNQLAFDILEKEIGM